MGVGVWRGSGSRGTGDCWDRARAMVWRSCVEEEEGGRRVSLHGRRQWMKTRKRREFWMLEVQQESLLL